MRKLQTREWVMLVGLAAVAGFVFFGNTGFQLGTNQDQVATIIPLGEAPVIALDTLGGEPVLHDRSGRSLFTYGPKPRVNQPAPPPKATPKPVKRTVLPPPKVTQTAPPPVVKRPPRIKFTYLGYLGPKEDRIAVFWENDEMILARIGEVVQEEFKVLEFKYEKVVMGYTQEQFKDQTTELAQQSK